MATDLETVLHGMLKHLPEESNDPPLTSVIASGLDAAMLFFAGGIMTGGEDSARAWLATDGLTASLVKARNKDPSAAVGNLIRATFALHTEQGIAATEAVRMALDADPADLKSSLCTVDALCALKPAQQLRGLRAIQRIIAVPTDAKAKTTLGTLLLKVLRADRLNRTLPSPSGFQHNLLDRLTWLGTKGEQEGLDKSSPRHVTTRIVLVLFHVLKDYIEHPPSPETQ